MSFAQNLVIAQSAPRGPTSLANANGGKKVNAKVWAAQGRPPELRSKLPRLDV
jgi:hypothetical protein